MNRKDQDTASTALTLTLEMRETPRRRNNAETQTWKQQLGSLGSRARLYGNERWLRSGKRQEGNDLVDPDGCRTWRHIFRHRRSLWSLHKRRTRGRSAGPTS